MSRWKVLVSFFLHSTGNITLNLHSVKIQYSSQGTFQKCVSWAGSGDGTKRGKITHRTGLSGLRYFKPNNGHFDRGGGAQNPRSTLNLGSKWDERHSVGHTRHFADFSLDDS